MSINAPVNTKTAAHLSLQERRYALCKTPIDLSIKVMLNDHNRLLSRFPYMGSGGSHDFHSRVFRPLHSRRSLRFYLLCILNDWFLSQLHQILTYFQNCFTCAFSGKLTINYFNYSHFINNLVTIISELLAFILLICG